MILSSRVANPWHDGKQTFLVVCPHRVALKKIEGSIEQLKEMAVESIEEAKKIPFLSPKLTVG